MRNTTQSDTLDMRTLAGNCTVQCITLNKQRLASTSAMRLENVDGLDGILSLSARISRLHSQHRVNSHGSKKIVIPDCNL